MMVLLALACTHSGTFEALTYNVAGLPQGLSSSDPERFIPQMGVLFVPYDLVLVQEDFAYHDDLVVGTDHPYRSEPAIPVEELVNDGLNRFSRFPFDPVERTRWTDCNGVLDDGSDCLAEKGFSTALTHFHDKAPVTVVNHHADAGGSEDDIATRASNFAQLAAALEGVDGPILMAGDTNLRVDTRPDDADTLGAFLEATGLQDVCTALACGEEHIDRFFFRSGDEVTVEPQSWRVATEMVSPEGDDLSDHPAIAVVFSWSF